MLRTKSRLLAAAAALSVAAVLASSGAAGAASGAPTGSSGTYKLTSLVSDLAGRAANQDSNLVNAWGLVAGPTTPWWVANNGTETSTLYLGDGSVLPLVVDVPGDPTGTVYNGGPNFVVTDGTNSGPATFLFDGEGGLISGWNSNVPPGSTQAQVAVDRSNVDAIYKGLAIASTSDGDFLYATDFHNARIDMFDGDFNLVTPAGAFQDPSIPKGYGPFGIQNIDGTLFVTYAKQDADKEDDVDGRGLGFVDMYDTSGNLLGSVARRGTLNAPWGLAMAPSDFGRFSNDLLIGNFGNGRINAYKPGAGGTYTHVGQLHLQNGSVMAISGLWALEFGNGSAAGDTNQLFFTAGPGDESHGQFGMIEASGS
jgi:uncharacterized protein (TIGR03118 family)